MAVLRYWYAECLNDSDCYSIVAKTKREVVDRVLESGGGYEEPVKKYIVYRDAFDLMLQVGSEGGGYGCGWDESTYRAWCLKHGIKP